MVFAVAAAGGSGFFGSIAEAIAPAGTIVEALNREFLVKLGEKVANAAKEGAFLGFGGERVSEPERTLLAELAQAVGGQLA